MKRNLILCLSILITGGGVVATASSYDQDTTIRPRRVQGPTGSFLGVELSEVTNETVQRLKLRQERGALIDGVTNGSSAAQAGLQKNDVIVKWDGEPIESAAELSRHIRETPAGRAVRLGVIRDGREIEVNVKLGERAAFARSARVARPAIASVRVRPDVQIRSRIRDRGYLGVELQGMTPQLAEYFGLSKRTGALVVFVFADSPAAKAGLKAGDVILSAGGETVESPMDLRRALSDKSEGTIEFKILRDKQEQTLRVEVKKGTNSWLLMPDDVAVTVGALAPTAIQIPKICVAPIAIQVPKIAITPMAIQVPKIAIEPMAIPTPKVSIAPMAIPTPQVDIAPMNIEIPKISIPPVKVVIVPKRIVL